MLVLWSSFPCRWCCCLWITHLWSSSMHQYCVEVSGQPLMIIFSSYFSSGSSCVASMIIACSFPVTESAGHTMRSSSRRASSFPTGSLLKQSASPMVSHWWSFSVAILAQDLAVLLHTFATIPSTVSRSCIFSGTFMFETALISSSVGFSPSGVILCPTYSTEVFEIRDFSLFSFTFSLQTLSSSLMTLSSCSFCILPCTRLSSTTIPTPSISLSAVDICLWKTSATHFIPIDKRNICICQMVCWMFLAQSASQSALFECIALLASRTECTALSCSLVAMSSMLFIGWCSLSTASLRSR